MWTRPIFRALGFALAAIHLFPAKKHLALFLDQPSFGEAWKGFGAILAIAILIAPGPLWRWKWRGFAFGLLAVVHAVPAYDHVPRFFVSMDWSDAWRGFGALVAMAFFLAPLRVARFRKLALAVVLAGCSTRNGAQADGGDNEGGTGGQCIPCVGDNDCNGGLCAQVGGDSYCTPACPNGNECSSDRICVSAMTASGQGANVCAATSGQCAATMDDAGASGPCGKLVPPNTMASCTCSGKNCTANGCYGGWWCNTDTNKCQAPPMDCGGGSDSGVPLPDAGPVTGMVGPNGGSVSRLYFAAVGDTRPPLIDDTSAYPSAIIQKIYGDIETLNPHPPFVISTGDYNFGSPFSGSAADQQISLYVTARSKFSGTLFPAMGNHECTGAVASNCGPNSQYGSTNNYTAFMSKLLGPIQKSSAYYSVNVDDSNGKWTSKFVFIAANAWNSAQASWLDSTLAQATTYTFIVRHEPHDANTAPGVTPSEQIVAQHPYTLCVVGHTHSYYHSTGSREVLIGNGGAPLSGNKNYGFGLFSQRNDGAIQVDMVDYMTGLADKYFHFVVKPDGSPTQ